MTKIHYYGHSCFGVKKDGYQLVIDPYGVDTVEGLNLPEVTANEVICSHGHSDHNAVECVTVVKSDVPSPFDISFLEVPHDDQGGSLRGMNKVHVIQTEQEKIIHFGDIGRDLEEHEIEQLKGADVIMIPVGGHFTIDASQAKQIIEQIQPKTAILMHFRSDIFGFGVLAHIETVKETFPNLVSYPTGTLELPCKDAVITLNSIQ